MKEETKKLMDEISKRESELQPLRNKLYEINSKEKIKEMKKKIGKCYKYRNSWGSGDKWWLYLKVIGVTNDGYYKLEVFQKTPIETEIKHDKQCGGSLLQTGITEQEYNKEKNKILKEMGLRQ